MTTATATTVDLAGRLDRPRHAATYVKAPQGYRYKGRHRRSISLERLAVVLMTGSIVVGFTAASLVTMIWPR